MYKTRSRRMQHRSYQNAITGKFKNRSSSRQGVPSGIKKAFAQGSNIEGNLSTEVKGGYRILSKGFYVFCPRSEMYPEIKSPLDFEMLRKDTVEFKVIKLDTYSAVVSRKKALAEHAWANVRNAMSQKRAIKGVVKNLQHYGIFVDIGAIDGLLHVSQIPRTRSEEPKTSFQVGQRLNVFILAADKKRNRISLSLYKQ